jgi:hypothetical protein
MRRSILTLAALAGVVPAASAQVGTMTWVMRMDIPDSMESRTAGLSEVEMRMTFASNGEMWAMQMQPGQSMVAAFPMADLSSVRLVALVPTKGDSFHVGIVMPPDIAAQMGGGIGFRVDGEIPKSFDFPFDLDSLMDAQQERSDAEKPTITNTGRRSTVGGVSCEEWTITTPGVADSTGPGEPVTMEMCLAEPSPMMKAWTEWVKARVPDIMKEYDEMNAEMRAEFGGRDLVPVRFGMQAPFPMVFELVSQSGEAPDATFFRLPDGLQPFPMEMFRGMMPAQSDN